jgi:RNA polymerase sigma-70 factor (ECF subfamily)
MGDRQREDPAERATRLFNEHHVTVLAYATRRVGAAAAADVASETFAVAWRRLPDVPEPGALPWLLATARNVLLAAARSDARRGAREARSVDRSQAAGRDEPDHAERAAELDVVRRALDRMPEPDRELLLLVAWDGLPLAQSAAVLGCSAGAVRVRWLRARRRFADALGAVDGEPPPQPVLRRQALAGPPVGGTP